MAFQRVGADVSAAERWRERGKSYAENIESPYQRHRLKVIAALLPNLKDKVVVDFGCGEGVLIRDAKKQGARDVIGIDIDAGLLDRAKDSGATRLLQGSVTRLEAVDTADCIIAANVAAYFTVSEDSEFYQHAARILRKGGTLVITHSNELFDAFTFNAFTVAFYQRHFAVDVSSLIVNPQAPNRMTFNIRENPLAYPEKLLRYGFDVERMEFMNRHLQPPLLTRDAPDDMQRERPDTIEVPASERWKLMFQCSMFGVRAVTSPR